MVKTIIIVTGGPGTGKSHMAAEIVKRLDRIAALSYDRIKETNFDKFGFDNKEQKEELNRFSLEEFYLSLRKQMRTGNHILTEYPFYQVHRERLSGLIEEYGYSAYTVYLYGDTDAIYQRGIRRDHESKRHPGHLMNRYHKEDYRQECLGFDAVPSYEQFCRMMETKDYNIMLGKIIPVDVTDIAAISCDWIVSQIRQDIL